MRFDFSKVRLPVSTSVVSLRTVYVLDADPSYDVKRTDEGRSGYIAVRTIRGEGNIYIDGIETKHVYSNTLLFTEYANVHRYCCSSDAWDFWWFEFNMEGSFIFPVNTVLEVGMLKNELEDCSICLAMLRREDDISKGIASAALNLLIYKWLQSCNMGKIIKNRHEDRINCVIDKMHRDLEEHLTVAAMAKMVGLSERRFRQVFEQTTGMNPKKYYSNIRMNTATELIQNTNLSLGEIAERLGFSSQFHFSREFSKYFHIAPIHYRKK